MSQFAVCRIVSVSLLACVGAGETMLFGSLEFVSYFVNRLFDNKNGNFNLV